MYKFLGNNIFLGVALIFAIFVIYLIIFQFSPGNYCERKLGKVDVIYYQPHSFRTRPYYILNVGGVEIETTDMYSIGDTYVERYKCK